jgi:glycosyltransferase involved in cell wall biosynthesis
MKLAIFYPDLLGPGGIPYETRSLIAAFVRGHCDVAAVIRDPAGRQDVAKPAIISNFVRTEVDVDYPVLRYRLSYAGLRALHKELREFAFDAAIIIGARRPENQLFAALLRLLKVPYVIFAHGMFSPELLAHRWGGGQKRLLRRIGEHCYLLALDRPFLRSAFAVRALSLHEQETLRRQGAKRLFVCPDGVDGRWLMGAPRQFRVRPGEPIKLLYLGRIERYQKGLDIIAGALQRDEFRQHFQAILAGPSAEKYREALGIDSPSLRLQGPVFGREKEELLDWPHFFIHVSRFEGMAKAPREAVGRGLPVIASLESNFGNWVEEYSMGFAVTATIESFAEALGRIKNLDSASYAQMSRKAFDFAQQFSWDRVAGEIRNAIESILSSPK